jgi:hypothetical protein
VAHECPRHGVPAFGFSACYDCLKNQGFGGGRLTDAERAFAGFYPTPPSDGWRPAMSLSSYELGATMSAEDSELLHALMAVGDERERLEFLA